MQHVVEFECGIQQCIMNVYLKVNMQSLDVKLVGYTKILEVNLFAFAYRLFHEDFSSIDGALHDTQLELVG